MSMKAWGVSWNENSVFLENGRFFDKIWAWEQLFCREKSEKKGILSTDCLDPKFSVVLTEFNPEW